MSDVQYLVEQYLAVWNETDAAARRRLIGEVFAADGRYTDPLADVRGADALDAVVGAAQAQFPGLVFRPAGPVDAHHGIARFGWELGPAEGDALVVGFDVAVTGEDGLIHSVLGFLDKVPAAG